MTKLNKDTEKRFDEKFEYAIRVHMAYVDKPKAIGKTLKQHLADELERQKNIPRGVSQWKNYGKEWGYWEYFEKKIKKEIIEKLEKMKGLHWQEVEDKYGNEPERVYEALLDQAIQTINDK